MSEPNLPDDLTAGWPDEPGKEDTEAFARALAANVPQLPDDALTRVEERMREEMRLQRRRWRRRLAAGGAVAAAVVAGVLWLMPDPQPVRMRIHRGDEGRQARAVTDFYYHIPLPVEPAPPTPAKPLIAVDAYQSLFAD
jgi:hypothetical protein